MRCSLSRAHHWFDNGSHRRIRHRWILPALVVTCFKSPPKSALSCWWHETIHLARADTSIWISTPQKSHIFHDLESAQETAVHCLCFLRRGYSHTRCADICSIYTAIRRLIWALTRLSLSLVDQGLEIADDYSCDNKLSTSSHNPPHRFTEQWASSI